jgi:AraC-like DNA-binding protein
VVIRTSRLAGLVSTSDRQLVSSNDRDAVVDGCTRALRPHRLALKSGNARLATRLHHLPLSSISINRLHYGSDVRVEPLTIAEDNFLFSVPITGSALIHYGREAAELRPGLATIVGPYEKFCFDIDSVFDQIVIRFDRSYVESVCAALAGDDRLLPVDFQLLVEKVPVYWGALIESAAAVAQTENPLERQRLFPPIEELIVGSLLLNHPHSRSTDLFGAVRTPLPAQIKRAIAYLRENIGEPIRLQEVAAYCGMSVRSLQLGFQRQFACSPTAWLRSERLNRVHAILSKAEPGSTTVAKVAFQFGFYHLGDFAAHYRARFGANPSTILAKR